MFTTIAYSAAADQAALALLPGVADPHVRVIANDILVPRNMAKLAGAYAIGVNLTQAQVVSASIRRLFPVDIRPADRVVTPPLTPAAWEDFFDNPLDLDPTEQFNVLTAEDAAGASRMSVIVWFTDGQKDQPSGDIFTIRAVGTTTLVAFAWTNGSLTFSQNLPAGRYACVGARGESAGLIAARFVPIGYTARPGFIGDVAVNSVDEPRFRYGRAGTWFEFDHDAPPTIDYFSATADTAETIHLDLIKLA